MQFATASKSSPIKKFLAIVLMAVTFGLTGCGALHNDDMQPGGSSNGIFPDAAHPRITFESGNIVLSLPNPGYLPKVTAEEAQESWKATGTLSDVPGKAQYAGTVLALYTENGRGGAGYSNAPVWVIAFTGYPEPPSGGMGEFGASYTSNPTALTDVLILVSADTGSAIIAMFTMPDSVSASVPTALNAPT